MGGKRYPEELNSCMRLLLALPRVSRACTPPTPRVTGSARLALVAALALGGLGACDTQTPATQALPERAVHHRLVLSGTPVHLVLKDCTVFRVEAEGMREQVVVTDPCPWPTVCTIQKLAADARFVTVELGRMAFGAGGCRATEGTWRSRDGIKWERRRNGKWIAPTR